MWLVAVSLASSQSGSAFVIVGCCCRTRVLHATAEGKPALETEYSDACGIRPAWAELVDKAGLVDFDLSETKTAFSITTRQQVLLQAVLGEMSVL